MASGSTLDGHVEELHNHARIQRPYQVLRAATAAAAGAGVDDLDFQLMPRAAAWLTEWSEAMFKKQMQEKLRAR
jgi:hypothetical protein